jgi:hypothetical protein
MTRSISPSRAGGSTVGVPPPKKTVLTGAVAEPRIRRASRISPAAWPG